MHGHSELGFASQTRFFLPLLDLLCSASLQHSRNGNLPPLDRIELSSPPHSRSNAQQTEHCPAEVQPDYAPDPQCSDPRRLSHHLKVALGGGDVYESDASADAQAEEESLDEEGVEEGFRSRDEEGEEEDGWRSAERYRD